MKRKTASLLGVGAGQPSNRGTGGGQQVQAADNGKAKPRVTETREGEQECTPGTLHFTLQRDNLIFLLKSHLVGLLWWSSG